MNDIFKQAQEIGFFNLSCALAVPKQQTILLFPAIHLRHAVRGNWPPELFSHSR